MDQKPQFRKKYMKKLRRFDFFFFYQSTTTYLGKNNEHIQEDLIFVKILN